MNLQELTRLVSLGEGASLEFKRKVPRPERIVKEIVAFANTHGGRVLLGVDDDGTIVGVRDAEEEEFSLYQALEAHCEPPVNVTVERISVQPRREVILVTVPASAAKPHFVRNEPDAPGRKAAYVRVKDMSVEASREAVRLMRSEKQPADVRFELGDKELLLLRYLDSYGRITVDQFATLADIPRSRASQTMVLLAKASVLQLHTEGKGDYFTLAYDMGPSA